MKQHTFDFVNTVAEEGEQLTKSKKKAITQQDKILAFFRKNSPMAFTPNDVRIAVFTANDFDKVTPLTSVRRGITQLTNAGYLIKTDDMRRGIYGKLNYTWKYNINGHE